MEHFILSLVAIYAFGTIFKAVAFAADNKVIAKLITVCCILLAVSIAYRQLDNFHQWTAAKSQRVNQVLDRVERITNFGASPFAPGPREDQSIKDRIFNFGMPGGK